MEGLASLVIIPRMMNSLGLSQRIPACSRNHQWRQLEKLPRQPERSPVHGSKTSQWNVAVIKRELFEVELASWTLQKTLDVNKLEELVAKEISRKKWDIKVVTLLSYSLTSTQSKYIRARQVLYIKQSSWSLRGYDQTLGLLLCFWPPSTLFIGLTFFSSSASQKTFFLSHMMKILSLKRNAVILMKWIVKL